MSKQKTWQKHARKKPAASKLSAKARQSRQDMVADVARQLGMKPDDPAMRRIDAQVRAIQGETEAAMATLDDLIANPPDASDLALNLEERARLKARTGDLPGAGADLDRAIELEPEHGFLWQSRAQIKAARGDRDGALADFEEALSREPDNEAAIAGRNELLEQDGYADCDLDQDQQAIYDRATSCAEAGNLAQARANLDSLIDQLPNVAKFRSFRAVLRMKLDDPAGAEDDLTTASQLEPANGKIFENLGLIRLISGEPRTALTALDQAIKLGRHNLYAFLCRGQAHQALDNPSAALADFSKAIDIDPHNPDAYIHRAKVKAKLDDLPGALKDMNQGIAIEPNPRIIEIRVTMHLQIGDLQAAAGDLDLLLQEEPDNLTHLLLRSTLRRELDDIKGAWEDCQRAEAIAPNDPELVKIKGILSKIGRLQ